MYLARGLRDVHFADELTTEGVDDTSHGGSGPLADEVKVQHTLDGSGLHTTGGELARIPKPSKPIVYSDSSNLLDEASCLVVEESVREGGEDPTRRVETGDVVVGGLQAIIGRAGQRSGLGHAGSQFSNSRASGGRVG